MEAPLVKGSRNGSAVEWIPVRYHSLWDVSYRFALLTVKFHRHDDGYPLDIMVLHHRQGTSVAFHK